MYSLIRNTFVALSLLAFAAVATAAPITVPFTFTAGTPAKAAEINADFQALVTAINALSVRVDKLDGITPAAALTAADVVGTYSCHFFGTAMTAPPAIAPAMPANILETRTLNGTLTIVNGGTGTFVGTRNSFKQANGLTAVLGVTIPAPVPTTPPIAWTVAGGVLSIPSVTNFTIASGGSLLINAGYDNAGGTSNINICVRN
jgi:hypothetical protein